MAADLDYSIIIPAYNEEETLPATLAGLRKVVASIPLTGEIIVVDNNSSDQTAAIATRMGARLVTEKINQIARARNTGARFARGKYLVFQDADTFVSEELLRLALERLASGQCAGGGALVEMEPHASRTARFCESLWRIISKKLHLAAGCFIYCSKEGFTAIGGFDESFYIGEEIGFSRKLAKWGKAQGLCFAIIPTPTVVTSNRKFDWYSSHIFLLWGVLYLFLPFLARSRRFCPLWYKRPDKSRTGSGSFPAGGGPMPSTEVSVLHGVLDKPGGDTLQQ